jgi:predicted nucleic acid-binding protein
MYVDSGVLLKLYLPEPESEAAQQTVATAVDLTCSELLLAEFQSALSRKHREGQIDTYAAVESMAALRRHIEQGAIGLVKLDSATIEAAVKLLAKMPTAIPLRTLDAIHLAVCLENKLFPLLTTDAVMSNAARHLDIPLLALPLTSAPPQRKRRLAFGVTP